MHAQEVSERESRRVPSEHWDFDRDSPQQKKKLDCFAQTYNTKRLAPIAPDFAEALKHGNQERE